MYKMVRFKYGPTTFICEHCGRPFTRHSSLKRHMKDIHNLDLDSAKDGEISLQFKNFGEFIYWKEMEEKRTRSSYVKQRGNQIRKNGDVVIMYHCCRSGVYRPRGRGIKSLKTQGSAKIGAICPSRMRANLLKESGKVTLKYFPKHKYHEIQLEYTRLSQADKEVMAGELIEAAKETDAAKFEFDATRDVKVEPNVHNIEGDSNIDDPHTDSNIDDPHTDSNIDDPHTYSNIDEPHNYSNIKDAKIMQCGSEEPENHRMTPEHQEDMENIKLWVEEMGKEGQDNCVIFFKEPGKYDEDFLLEEEDFILVTMTDFQRKMLKKYEDEICLDATRGINNHDFHLYTMFVVDEFRNGWPVAFCLSNRSTVQLLTVFFRAVKDVVDKISCTTLITDDAPEFYNAWCKVMGPVPNVLSCVWHVMSNWQRNLWKVRHPDKRKLVFETAETIRDQLWEESFAKLLESFVNDLHADEDTIEFGRYFLKNYAGTAERWAYCFRKDLGIDTTMYLESLRKKIKHQYTQSRHVEKLDAAVERLLKLVKDLIVDRLINVSKHNISERNSEATLSGQEDNFLEESLQVPLEPIKTSSVNSSIKMKLESILAIVNECEFTQQESDVIQRHLDTVLVICNENLKTLQTT